jgi:hypothetical protein
LSRHLQSIGPITSGTEVLGADTAPTSQLSSSFAVGYEEQAPQIQRENNDKISVLVFALGNSSCTTSRVKLAAVVSCRRVVGVTPKQTSGQSPLWPITASNGHFQVPTSSLAHPCSLLFAPMPRVPHSDENQQPCLSIIAARHPAASNSFSSHAHARARAHVPEIQPPRLFPRTNLSSCRPANPPAISFLV